MGGVILHFGMERKSQPRMPWWNKSTWLSLISNHNHVSTDLSVLLVRRGVVGDLEEVQVDDFFHLIVVSSTLTYDHRRIEQEDVPVVQRCHYVWRDDSNKSDLLHVITPWLSSLTEVLTFLSIFCVPVSSCDGFNLSYTIQQRAHQGWTN